MAEIKKTLTILKIRWPEVALIIGVNFLNTLLSKLFRAVRPDLGITWVLPYRGFLLLIMTILIILYFGFLRTIYLEGQKRQSVAVLLRTGIHFLWRMIVLGALYTIPLVALTLLSARLISPGEIRFLYRLLPIVVNIILIKFILLIPALVIVLDCRAFASFKFIKQYKLSNAKELVGLFLFQMAFDLFLIFMAKLTNATTTSHYIFMIARLTIRPFLGLMVYVTAVRFVASLELMYDDDLSCSDS